MPLPHRLLFILLSALACTAPGRAQPHRALWERGDYESALRQIESQLEEDATSTLALELDRAELLFLVGRIDEAIAALEPVATAYPLPSHSLRLARLYRYRGRLQDYDTLLQRAARQMRALMSYRLNREQWLSLGRLMELQGEDPQTVLGHYQRLAQEHPDYAPGLVAAGDLASSRYAYDIAARQYGRALEIDADNQEALAGLANCYFQSGDPRLRQTLERLLSLNPRQPRALLLRAERQLDLGQVSEALTTLETLLAFNPNHLEALSLRAAALFLADRPEEAETTRQRALAINAHTSAPHRISGRIASRHYRFSEGLSFQRRALEIDPQDHSARLQLALDLLRLGRDIDARAELEAVFAADPYNVRAFNLLNVSDVIAQFSSVRREPFLLQMPPMEAEILAAPALELLEETADLYQKKYRVELQSPVLVQVFADHDEFMVRSVGLPGNAGHLGICFGQVVTMDSPRARPPGAMNWHRVLWHEFVHVITLQKTHNRIPRWLSEGISVYEEARGDSSWGQRLDPDFKAVADESIPAVEELEAYFIQPPSQEHLLYGYFAAGEFVHFYADAYGDTALVRSLEDIGAGRNALEALSAAAGQPLASVNLRFRRHLEERLAPLAHLPDSTDAADDAPFSRALLQGDQALQAGDFDAAERAYLKAHDLYPDYASDDAPLRRLALLYKENDRPQHYMETLQRIVSRDPTAYEEGLEVASLLAASQRWDKAASVLQRTAQIVPFHIPLLTNRTDYLIAAGDLDAALLQLRKVIYLDPARGPRHRLQLARTLARQGATPAAKSEVIALLEEMPSFWDAQQLLLEIVEEGDQP